ncbi:hypothetical protein [Laribacter hongkongensis]|uniref:hypothetical protein n=1 Tax=Laribacter hongkongensis TaxID=168471 RepID=UPI001EFEBEB6|nr:hypothetical protein [Laribacter hongkongensis]MCG9093778.1 hypothetical protein [Laribacter hongkongensis]
MHDAINPLSDELITVVQYDKDFGRGELGHGGRPMPAKCPICVEKMWVRGGSRQRHFYHIDNHPCPTKKISAAPFLTLRDLGENPAEEEANIAFLRLNWERVYQRIKLEIPFFHLGEFILLLKEAKRIRLFAYRDLEAWTIPYLMMALKDFTPATGAVVHGEVRRELSFRCFFQSRSNLLDELWIRRSVGPAFFRLSFHGETITRVKSIEKSADYLEGALEVTFTEKQRKWVENVIDSVR